MLVQFLLPFLLLVEFFFHFFSQFNEHKNANLFIFEFKVSQKILIGRASLGFPFIAKTKQSFLY